jgi:DNA repair photolyase
MIISASRRTDIPAFYSDWFFNRIKEGFLLVRNPMNIHQVSRINLTPDVVDCIVFWTKNPGPMINRLSELNEYNYYFQFTLNSYDKSIEPDVPEKKILINTFQELSKKLGKDRVIWRYDPILLTDSFDIQYHIKWFEYLANKLNEYTNKCVISFVDLYKKTERNLKGINMMPMDKAAINNIASQLSLIASKYHLQIESCSEDFDLDNYNIKHGKCIDDTLISKIIGKRLNSEKDPNQRLSCGCIKSLDIGAYNTCKHNCFYCYANLNKEVVKKNIQSHNDNSPLICGELGEKDKINVRTVSSNVETQFSIEDYISI